MPANVDGMVREGVSAYRAGRKDEARALLLRAVEIDQYNEQAWLWLSAVVESVDEQRTCLENVLTINPGNERAQQGLNMLTQKSSPVSTPKAASSQADDVLASASFTSTPTPTPSKPSATPFASDDDELPSSIEWDAAPPTASSSASSSYRVSEPSPAEYDDWVSNLNLGSSGAVPDTNTAGLEAAAQFASAAFDDVDDDLFNFDTKISDNADDDLFSSGPFSAPDTPMPEPAPQPPPRTFTPPPPPAAKSSGGKKAADALLDEIEDEANDSAFLDEFENGQMEKLDSAEFFQYIPKEIKATRLPGTRERYSALLILGFVALFLANIGAVALLVTNLTAP